MNIWPAITNIVMLIVGPRGSGKTELAKDRLRSLRHVTVFDTKGDFSFDRPEKRSRLIARTPEEVFALWRGIEAQGDGAPVIYRPDISSPRFYADVDEVARVSMLRGCCINYYDELADCMNVSNYERVAPHWKRTIQQGREPAKVGVICVTQRPARIPVITYSEADWRATFFLRTEADRDRVEESFGDVPWKALARNKHAFVYATDETAQSDAPLTLHRLNLPAARSAAPTLKQRSA